MVFHFDCKPPVVRIERRSLGHSPGFKDAVVLEPQIIVQARRIVLLDHEAQLFRWPDRRLAARLGGLFEIPLLPVGGETSQGQCKNLIAGESAQKQPSGTETCESR